jgi:beta-fructofuranosidase
MAAKNFVSGGIYRQTYHFMPPAYWMNDPNGFVYFKGEYHLYYQHNPFSTVWADMHWGHATSSDLINWQYQSVAIAPSEAYDDSLRGGIWSGTTLIHDGKLFVMYTACIPDGDTFVQKQCLAWSLDGYKFYKYAGNPVLSAPEELEAADFRDPKLWEHDGKFYCIVASKKEGRACLGIFVSDNLETWEYKGIFLEGNGLLGEMWECPDFFMINGRYILQICPIGMGKEKSVCLMGDFDYTSLKFRYERIFESDAGFDFYAPETTLGPDGKRYMIGYQNSWFWMDWFSGYGLSQMENWCGCMGLPREVVVTGNGKLRFEPVRAVSNLYRHKVEIGKLNVGSGERKSIAVGDNIHYEMDLHIDLDDIRRCALKIHLRKSETEDTVIEIDFAGDRITLDRRKSRRDLGEILFGVQNKKPAAYRASRPLYLEGKKVLDIRVFSDTSGLEIFVNGGEQVFTCNVFSGTESRGIEIESIGYGTVLQISGWSIGPCMLV